MKETQSEINEFLIENHITDSEIEKITSEKLNYKDKILRCPRCQSGKLRIEKVEWTDTDEFDFPMLDGLMGKARYKDKVICNVCGYWLTDPNNEKGFSMWNTIKKLFKKN
ncbi:hypothetical protein ICJ85_16135 [Aestuariibaculum marinum]|uniref:Uncharacterized protein n=2 Tax=Aestuariibaculum marinum TaxID=2683592 RepID=A0A8J6U668_9FLAO|nr:hypothetical protein [Aestuariibaculum marinum]